MVIRASVSFIEFVVEMSVSILCSETDLFQQDEYLRNGKPSAFLRCVEFLSGERLILFSSFCLLFSLLPNVRM